MFCDLYERSRFINLNLDFFFKIILKKFAQLKFLLYLHHKQSQKNEKTYSLDSDFRDHKTKKYSCKKLEFVVFLSMYFYYF